MNWKGITPVPNNFFEVYLPKLSASELKILLVIIRQTYGWIDFKTRRRKQRDRISHSQFIQKTGLSKRIISQSVTSLIHKRLITLSDYQGNSLNEATKRKGYQCIYYSSCLRLVQNGNQSYGNNRPRQVQNSIYNKRNNKEKRTKENVSFMDYKIKKNELVNKIRVSSKG